MTRIDKMVIDGRGDDWPLDTVKRDYVNDDGLYIRDTSILQRRPITMMAAIVLLLALLTLAAGEIAHNDPHFAPGHDAIVHLFEWKWDDVAKECEQFLGPSGFGGIQVCDKIFKLN